jgi:two-component system response regulator QseB
MRILIVEDDELLGSAVCMGLRQDSHTVDWVKDGRAAQTALKVGSFDCIILDLGLPNLSGLALLKKLRNNMNKTPVLILTAKETVEDKIKGLDTGADDYMIKPFDLTELLARLRALHRRSYNRAETIINYKEICLDPTAHKLTVAGKEIVLPRREFALLQKLLERIGRVSSRELLMQTLYRWDENVTSNALEVHIHNLRKKLNVDYIHTIRGVGYLIKRDN